jgi:cytolysin (calcineurin-like family phosphatase)
MVTNNRNNARIVSSGVYTWVRLKAIKETTQFSSVQSVVKMSRTGSTYISSSAVRVLALPDHRYSQHVGGSHGRLPHYEGVWGSGCVVS